MTFSFCLLFWWMVPDRASVFERERPTIMEKYKRALAGRGREV